MNQLKISSNSISVLGFQLRTKLTCYFCFSASQLGQDKLEHDSTQYQSGDTGGDMNIGFSQAARDWSVKVVSFSYPVEI